jgi:hypothetical protein
MICCNEKLDFEDRNTTFFFFVEIVTDLLKRKWDGKYIYMQGVEAGAAGK